MSTETNEQKTKQMLDTLDIIYRKVIDGIPKISPSIEDFANDYLTKHATVERASQAMLKNQVLKCTTSGAISGFGGLITLPIAIPANVSSVLYIQMRMIACTAHMSGFDIKSDQVQTLIYACLAGISVNSVLKNTGIQMSQKFAHAYIRRIPIETLKSINRKVGFRFITKSGETSIVNLTKLIPAIGAITGGGFDFIETKIIANRSYKWFVEYDFNYNEPKKTKKAKKASKPQEGDIIDI